MDSFLLAASIITIIAFVTGYGFGIKTGRFETMYSIWTNKITKEDMERELKKDIRWIE